MSATQPNLGSGARRLAALSCGLAWLGLAACGRSSLPAGLEATTSREGQSPDPSVMNAGAGGRPVGTTTPVAGRPPTAPVGPPPGSAGVAGGPPPMARDAGVGRDGGFGSDGGMPVQPDGGFVGMDAGLSCSDGVYPGSLDIFDKRGLMMLRGCKQINGSLTISAEAIDDLSDLRDLSLVAGLLQIRGSGSGFGPSPSDTLRSLKGLEGLQSVGSLALIGLAGVTSLEPLSQLAAAIEVQIIDMDALTNLNGLGKVVWQNLTISDSAQLKTLEGLPVSEKVGAIQLLNDPMLSDLKGLAALTRLGTLSLMQLSGLKTLEGLQGLQPDYEQLTITDCNGLTDLTGLGAYGHINEITNNAELRSLAGPTRTGLLLGASIGNCPKLESLGAMFSADASALPSIVLIGLPSLKSLVDLKALPTIESLGIGTCDGLKDLTGLEALTSAQQIEISDCAGLQSLKGLDGLQNLGGLHLQELHALTSLQGMPKLQSLANLRISGCSSLPSLQGLDLLTQLGEVELAGNLALTSLHGLEKVTEIMLLNLISNIALPNLMGLSGLQKIGYVEISGNPALKNLQGIGLRSADSISIDSNPVLTDLTGLENLAGITNGLSILQNSSLISLRALSALTSAGELVVQDNRRLPQCEVDWLAKRVNRQVSMGTNGPPGTCPP